ncbi:PREDICTED: uncharacterized protein LOC101623744 [Condylura cristata]|uniref:uncharacterized protein LOC101623744 n=1 Tax=Condylura cristata TaxID=143302 RepID=UPI0006436EA7|nr:PREDICTED: uncharacterized protein LOC101623744 [Condylura cristata]
MARTPLLLALLSLCTGSLSQPVLTQPPSLAAAPGATARLTCALRSGLSVGSYGIFWQQQLPGRPPRYLLSYKSDSEKHQGAGVPSRFSGASDTSANAGVLVISGPQPEDEADYYCATWDGLSASSQCCGPGGNPQESHPQEEQPVSRELQGRSLPRRRCAGARALHRQGALPGRPRLHEALAQTHADPVPLSGPDRRQGCEGASASGAPGLRGGGARNWSLQCRCVEPGEPEGLRQSGDMLALAAAPGPPFFDSFG